MDERDDEIKVLGEINIELESGTHKLIEKLSQEKVSQKETLEEFNLMVECDDEIKEKDSPYDLYGFMYDTDDDASISGKSCEHFGWDWPEKDSPGIEVDWQGDSFHETEDLFVGLDQPIQVVVVQNNVQQEVTGEVVFNPLAHEEVTEEAIEIASDQAEALSDQEVADDCLDDEHVEERIPSKRIRVTQKVMVKDEKPKKG
ncbi:hypothetical protein Tco_1015534 [Tanacetum coccineum]|uniref:Uncharacterized protein n=1 Tax=Tanacetum coccineum TaxID=301880 RepID=A0ABQ5FM55_9ASTR